MPAFSPGPPRAPLDATQLAAAARDGRGGVRIFAASPFLGELKSALGDATLARLVATHDADLTALDLGGIERRLGQSAH